MFKPDPDSDFRPQSDGVVISGVPGKDHLTQSELAFLREQGIKPELLDPQTLMDIRLFLNQHRDDLRGMDLLTLIRNGQLRAVLEGRVGDDEKTGKKSKHKDQDAAEQAREDAFNQARLDEQDKRARNPVVDMVMSAVGRLFSVEAMQVGARDVPGPDLEKIAKKMHPAEEPVIAATAAVTRTDTL